MSPLLAIVAFQATAFDPVKDPAFAKPLTLKLSMTPLRTVVSTLAKETGQPLDSAGLIADWKATVLVKGLPAGRTMEALADALGLVWKKEGSRIMLSRPEGQAAEESAYLRAEAEVGARGGPNTQTMVLNEGGTTFAEERPGRRIRPARGGGNTPMVRFSPDLMAMEGMGMPPPSRLNPILPTGSTPFVKAIVGWPSLPKEALPEWVKPIPAPVIKAAPMRESQFSLADLLLAWHEASGLPVVADAFRIPMKNPVLSPGTALESIQALASANTITLKVSDGVARLRHPGFWRLRLQEIPEHTWNIIERSTPTIDTLASFASALKPAQAASFRSAESPISKVNTRALEDAYPALVLWTALPLPAKRSILAGSPVALAAVRNVTNTYVFALREAPFYDAGNPSRLLSMEATELGIFGRPATRALELRLASENGPGVTYTIAY